MLNYQQLAQDYKSELLQVVMPFWEQYSIDREAGGFFTCLLRDGQVFDTDKFIWLQARQVWLFAMLYEKCEARPAWLETARHGADYLEKYGRDKHGNWYFSLDRIGKPLIQAYNIFSDCFAAMAFGQLFKATQEERYGKLAVDTFNNILLRQDNPKGIFNKSYPGTRPLKNFALPMILCNLCLELESLLPAEQVEKIINDCLHEVMEIFYDTERGLILENVQMDGQFSDNFDGRLLNPGHAIEAMWFIMDLAVRKEQNGLLENAAQRCIQMLEKGWDQEYGGIFYFLDAKGYPPQQLEWDQKLWWVHLETLIALSKAILHTGEAVYEDWFKKVHTYTWKHFRDPEYGEWYGYLNRQGEVLLPLKGGKWKGCFHVPRGLWQCWQTLEKCS